MPVGCHLPKDLKTTWLSTNMTNTGKTLSLSVNIIEAIVSVRWVAKGFGFLTHFPLEGVWNSRRWNFRGFSRIAATEWVPRRIDRCLWSGRSASQALWSCQASICLSLLLLLLLLLLLFIIIIVFCCWFSKEFITAGNSLFFSIGLNQMKAGALLKGLGSFV